MISHKKQKVGDSFACIYPTKTDSGKTMSYVGYWVLYCLRNADRHMRVNVDVSLMFEFSNQNYAPNLTVNEILLRLMQLFSLKSQSIAQYYP